MTRDYIRLLTLLGCAGALFSAAPTRAQQSAAPAGSIPVLVLIPEGGANRYREITVTRRPSDGGYIVVLPKEAASAENFRAAVRTVTRLLDRDGDAFRDDSIFRVPSATSAPASATVGLGSGSARGSTRVLARLLASAPRDTHGVRRAHATYIYLPGQAARAAARASGTQPVVR